VVFPDRALPLEKQVSDPAVTHLSVVSTQLLRLLDAGADLSGLKAVLAGGGPFPEKLIARAIQSGAPIHLTYGMTEAASQIATSGRLLQVPSPLHCGRPLADREVRISDEGMIQIRGPMVSPDVLDGEGWFSTGDLGRFDSGGNLVILGRLDRMFISGGENIQPEAIEVLLSGVPGIERAAVVGVPDAEFGMRPVAFVCGEFREAELREILRSRLEAFAVPGRFLDWPDGVDAGAAKVDYRALERLARGAC
jgi:O-succinylbenzoic acid--CoA ligase